MTYQTEGYINSISLETIMVKGTEQVVLKFTLNPSSPYVFEEKATGGKVDRKIIFTDATSAVIRGSDAPFVLGKLSSRLNLDVNSLLILKADKLKVRVSCENDPTNGDVEVSKIDVL